MLPAWLLSVPALCGMFVVQGNRQDIKGLASGSQKVLNEVLYLIDKHDLYGYVAYPKAHAQSDISVRNPPFAPLQSGFQYIFGRAVKRPLFQKSQVMGFLCLQDIYSYARYTHGIFVNPALQEPFGLTVIEV